MDYTAYIQSGRLKGFLAPKFSKGLCSTKECAVAPEPALYPAGMQVQAVAEIWKEAVLGGGEDSVCENFPLWRPFIF